MKSTELLGMCVTSVRSTFQDSLDEPELLKVQFERFLASNASLIDGHCVGGWKKIGSTCFLFVPARMNYQEAKKFCQVNRSGNLPTVDFTRTNFVRRIEFLLNS